MHCCEFQSNLHPSQWCFSFDLYPALTLWSVLQVLNDMWIMLAWFNPLVLWEDWNCACFSPLIGMFQHVTFCCRLHISQLQSWMWPFSMLIESFCSLLCLALHTKIWSLGCKWSYKLSMFECWNHISSSVWLLLFGITFTAVMTDYALLRNISFEVCLHFFLVCLPSYMIMLLENEESVYC